MPGRNFLFVPGPTNVPDRILRAMHVAMEDHRSSNFPSLTKPLLSDLKKIFKTESGQCFIFPSSGTGGWEATLSNTLSPGDKVLSARFGQFSHLWIEMAQRLGLDVQAIETEWGEAAPVERIAEALQADGQHQIKAVMIVQNETATGVTSDIAGVRRALDAARHPALLFIDGVSSIGGIDFRMDEWKVDAAVVGTQKAFMLPPGAAVVCVSRKAIAAGEQATMRRAYFEFRDQIAQNANGYFPYTPSVPMLYGLRESVAMLLEEGLDTVFARHHRYAEGVRAAVKAWGLELCAKAPRWYSDTVSAVMVPPQVKSDDVITIAYKRYNLSLGAGLSKMAGKLFRIGHMGDLNELMLLGALAGAEMAMRDAGVAVVAGSGVAAAAEYWRSTAKPLDAGAAGRPQATPQPAAVGSGGAAGSGANVKA
jgi:alanine-glyoxylate transaminase/serine-glyoxylate transaminase/serine-pyruvate transaminase